MIYNLYAAELLTFTESHSNNPFGRQVLDQLLFTETDHVNLKSRSGSDLLLFRETSVLGKTLKKSGSDTLVFVESASPRVYVFSEVENILFIENHSGYVGDVGSDTLVFVETNDVQVVKISSDTLVFVETNSVIKVRNLSGSDTLLFVEGNSVFKPTKKFIANPATLGSSDIRLKFGSTQHTFRKYLFGNSESVNYSRINRKSAGGDIIVAAASDNVVTTLAFTIRMLSCDDLAVLQQFLHDTVGQIIEFRDHENNNWEGVVVTPNNPQSQTGRNTYSLSLEFQGVRV